jgi:DNA-binding beta-propeller fold protein YncE
MRVTSTALVIAVSLGLTAACSITSTPLSDPATTIGTTSTPDPAVGLLDSGRLLTPYGAQVQLGNYPTGAAATADGRFLWTVSTGFVNDLRIVDVASGAVCQTIALPGASGGIALDSSHRLAYVSGLPASAMTPSQKGLAGAKGDAILVYSWTDTCGEATLLRTIGVPPPAGSQPPQQWPPLTKSQRPGAAAKELSWPQKLAVSPDGSRLLVPLNLVDSAAVVDLGSSDAVRYVATGRFPFAAAITPDGATGLVTNEAAGTVSVLDLATATKVADVVVGTGLSHAQAIAVDAAGGRAYVSLSESDLVVVVDLDDRTVERTIAVGIPAGLGTRPVSLAVARDRLYVAQSGDDEITVVALPTSEAKGENDWTVVGRIPTTDLPQAVAVTAPASGTAQLLYVTAKGVGVGPNPTGPNPASTTDPIFAVFSTTPPTTDVFTSGPVTYDGTLVTGIAGIGPVPTDAQLVALTAQAQAQMIPVGSTTVPTDTVVRPDGPITHVFFVVRENRSYDQMLGDVGRGNSDPALNVFDATVTPNMHAMVERFPLLDNTYANSEASIEGHFWTSATTVPDYASRNWIQNYAARGRPNDFGEYAVSWPGNGFLFDQAERQGISYFNFGEGLAGNEPAIADVDRTEAQTAESAKVAAKSDIGPPFGGCYPGSYTIGFTSDKKEIYDGSLPIGAPAGSFSHIDCFRQRFAAQVAADDVPTFTYLSMTGDHTLGTIPGARTPAAMIADDDKAIGELVETISHSPIWASSAIFVVEDDSQDGADHVAAHRIPALVISPYAKTDAVVSTRYDLLSVIRTMGLMIGLDPLTLNDALATPMYDAFTTTPVNLAPWTTLTPQVDLLARNTAASPAAAESAALSLGSTDSVSQVLLDVILWKSVYGSANQPPPPGPGSAVANGIVDDHD